MKSKSNPLFVNKRLVYFEHLGFQGAFDNENGSHNGNVRKTVLKRSRHLKCPTFTQHLEKVRMNL